jgi:hypothetical protein
MTSVAAALRTRAASGSRPRGVHAVARLQQAIHTCRGSLRKVHTFVHTRTPALLRRQPAALEQPGSPGLDYVRGRTPRTKAQPVSASFAPAHQPTVAAGTARRAVKQAPDLERVVKELHERLDVRVERTVHEQVQRKLANRSRFARGLADRIQTELYHDIVFERERLGLRGAP